MVGRGRGGVASETGPSVVCPLGWTFNLSVCLSVWGGGEGGFLAARRRKRWRRPGGGSGDGGVAATAAAAAATYRVQPRTAPEGTSERGSAAGARAVRHRAAASVGGASVWRLARQRREQKLQKRCHLRGDWREVPAPSPQRESWPLSPARKVALTKAALAKGGSKLARTAAATLRTAPAERWEAAPEWKEALGRSIRSRTQKPCLVHNRNGPLFSSVSGGTRPAASAPGCGCPDMR